MNLTDEQINQAVAEWMGWTDLSASELYHGHKVGNRRGLRTLVPRYVTDLNAVAEAEARLTRDQCFEYNYELDCIWRKSIEAVPADSWLWHLTAKQRCIALLRTVRSELFQS